MERQGDYNDILQSGIDFTSILNKEKEEDDEKYIENDGVSKIPRQSSDTTLESSMTSKMSLNSEKNHPGESRNQPSSDEEKQLLKELEASSKGKVKGSLILKYLKSSNQPCTLVFLVISFLLVQILASVVDIFVSYW